MLVCVLIILWILNSHHHAKAWRFPNIGKESKNMNSKMQEAISGVMKTIDNLGTTCLLEGHFYNGSCFYYLTQITPPKPEGVKDILVGKFSFHKAANYCRKFDAELWNIETIDELSDVLVYTYNETTPNQHPYIAVNFTFGKYPLYLNKSMSERMFSLGNQTNFTLTYKPGKNIAANNTCLIIEIVKREERIDLEEEECSMLRSDHIMCKKKINSCFNNTRCTAHGRCINLITDYRCQCNFMYKGKKDCNQFSEAGIQSMIAAGLIGLTVLLVILHSFGQRISIKKNEASISVRSSHRLSSTGDVCENPVYSNFIDPSHSSSSIFFRHSLAYYSWRIFLGFITILFATVCCLVIYLWKIDHIPAYQKLHNLTDDASIPDACQLLQENLNSFYRIPINKISLGILFGLIASQLFFHNWSSRKKATWRDGWTFLSVPVIFNGHSHIFRFQSAAVFGIIALEIVNIFDEFILHGATYFIYGPLVDILAQFGIGILLGLRYCPILSIFEKEMRYKDRLGNIISYGLGAIYLYCEMIFKILSDINCVADKGKMSMIKGLIKRLREMGINFEKYIMNNLGTNQTTKFNGTNRLSRLRIPNEIEQFIGNLTLNDRNELASLNFTIESNKPSIFYNVLRNAPYYYFMTYVAICLTVLFLQTFRQKFKKSFSLQSLARWKYVRYNLLQSNRYIQPNELVYYSCSFRCLNSLVIFFKKYVYSIRPYFRYSKLMICINTTALTLVYYFTFWIQDRIYGLTKKLCWLVYIIICGLSTDLCRRSDLNNHEVIDRINREIKYVSFLTAAITCLQLYLGLKHYQVQMCRAYRGVFTDIPNLKYMSAVTIVSKSIRYPGRFMGSLVYSYGFLFAFVTIFYILVRYIFYALIMFDFGPKFFLPMLILFAFQYLVIRLVCKLLFIRNNRFLALRNLRLFHTLSYFTFFFDCFLGFIMCLSRITKGICCTLIFFSRLDYTPYGRGLEMWDSSYVSYITFFHVEKNQRHPVVNVFTDIIQQRLFEIRKWKRTMSDCPNETHERRTLARFRWALVYTLIHNEQLKRYRKHRIRSNNTVQYGTLGRLFGKMGLTQTLNRK